MTTWEITKELLRGANIKWRKLFVFGVLALLVTGAYAGFQGRSKTEAAVSFDPSQYREISSVNLNVNIGADGKITADGKDISQSLKILPDSYEVKVQAVDKPGTYIDRFLVQFNLPKEVGSIQNIKTTTYAIHGVSSHTNSFPNNHTILFEADGIYPSASYTVTAYLPKWVLEPPLGKKITFFFSEMPLEVYLAFAIGIPLIALVVLLGMLALRRSLQFIKNDIGPDSTLPEDLPPAVAGVLVDGRMGSREIAATLIDLACRGYIFITRNGQTFSFGKRKSLNLESLPSLKPFEQILLTKIFQPDQFKSTREDVEVRVGHHIFSRKIANVYLEIYNETTRLGYFVNNPAGVHMKWKYSGIVLYFLGFAGFIHNAVFLPDPKFTLFLWIGEMLIANLIIYLSGLMPTRSEMGAGKLKKWLAFKNYLKLNQPIEKGTDFEATFIRFLPYAIVFGVEAEWSKRFLDEPFTKPGWYESYEPVVTLESFIPGLFPLIGFVGQILASSHEPTVE